MNDIPMGQATVHKELICLHNKSAEVIYFDRPEKQVVCFSSQINCAVGCLFCASAGDNSINLTSDEMLNLIGSMMNKYGNSDKIVLFSFMGEGEPLLNYKNVLSVMHKLPLLYSNSKMSLSTSGVAPDKIELLAHESFNIPFKLQVSIHSLQRDVREWLMPHAKSINVIKSAIDYYHNTCGREIELNFTLMDGINDSAADAFNIIKMFPDSHIKISQYNSIGRDQFKSSPKETIENFVQCLHFADISVEYHATDGSDIGAACGQLRGETNAKV